MLTVRRYEHLARRAALLLGTLVVCGNASADEYVRVTPDLELYYQEAGSGTPIIFKIGRAHV